MVTVCVRIIVRAMKFLVEWHAEEGLDGDGR